MSSPLRKKITLKYLIPYLLAINGFSLKYHIRQAATEQDDGISTKCTFWRNKVDMLLSQISFIPWTSSCNIHPIGLLIHIHMTSKLRTYCSFSFMTDIQNTRANIFITCSTYLRPCFKPRVSSTPVEGGIISYLVSLWPGVSAWLTQPLTQACHPTTDNQQLASSLQQGLNRFSLTSDCFTSSLLSDSTAYLISWLLDLDCLLFQSYSTSCICVTRKEALARSGLFPGLSPIASLAEALLGSSHGLSGCI